MFTLEPSGLDRSTINLHFPGQLGFGITPKGLTCVLAGVAVGGMGPTMQCREASFSRYCCTTVWFSNANRILKLDNLHLWEH